MFMMGNVRSPPSVAMSRASVSNSPYTPSSFAEQIWAVVIVAARSRLIVINYVLIVGALVYLTREVKQTQLVEAISAKNYVGKMLIKEMS